MHRSNVSVINDIFQLQCFTRISPNFIPPPQKPHFDTTAFALVPNAGEEKKFSKSFRRPHDGEEDTERNPDTETLEPR